MSAIVSYLQVMEKYTEDYVNPFLRQSHVDALQWMTLHLSSPLVQKSLYSG